MSQTEEEDLEKEGSEGEGKTSECGVSKPKEGSVSRRRKQAGDCAESHQGKGREMTRETWGPWQAQVQSGGADGAWWNGFEREHEVTGLKT